MAIENKVEQFKGDADTFSAIVNGDSSTTVQTASGPVPTIAKVIADAQGLIYTEAHQPAAAAAALAAQSEANAAASAQQASEALEVVLGGQVNADWDETDPTNKSFIKNKPEAPVPDLDKPISTATQEALDLKADANNLNLFTQNALAQAQAIALYF